MRILFMGTPDFAVPALAALDQKYEVVCVVSQPDKPKGRGHAVVPTATKEYALMHGIPVEQPEKLKDGSFLNTLEQYQPDMIVVAAYGRILPDYILEYPKMGCINIHGSLLPKYRGAAPIQWAVLNGEKQSGVTIMHMAHELDAGDIILMKSINIGKGETSGELFDRISLLGADAVLEAIEKIIDGTAQRIPQDHTKATFSPMLTKEMSEIDFSMAADKIEHYVCGLNPWPIATLTIQNQKIKVFRAQSVDITDHAAGTICDILKEGIKVACGDGKTILLQSLQRPGKKTVDGYAFAQGLRLKIGDKLE